MALSPAPSVTRRRTCRLCGSAHMDLAVSLAGVPIVSPNMGAGRDGPLETRTAPLEVHLCRDCGLLQLLHVVDADLVYRDYLYRTAISKGLADHFRGMASAVIERLALPKGSLIVEFGSNDGTLLSFFKAEGMAVRGVDPATAIAAEATARGIPTTADFFSPALADAIRAEAGAAKVIISNNCLANIDDLDGIFQGLACLLDDDGVFVCETQYGPDVFTKFLLDTIYHEHLSYFSMRPFVLAAARHGLQVFEADLIDTKGGSIRFWLQRLGGQRPVSARVGRLTESETASGIYDLDYLRQFEAKTDALRREIQEEVAAVRARKGSVAVFGTSVGCIALIHQFELQQVTDYLLDDSPFKDRFVGPDYSLPVHRGADTGKLKPDLVIILAWRYADGIMAKYRDCLAEGGRFIVPLPGLRIVERGA